MADASTHTKLKIALKQIEERDNRIMELEEKILALLRPDLVPFKAFARAVKAGIEMADTESIERMRFIHDEYRRHNLHQNDAELERVLSDEWEKAGGEG